MDNELFNQNLQSISAGNRRLYQQLYSAKASGRYSFFKSRSGEIVPAIIDNSHSAHSLHSAIDPRREAERLIASLKKDSGQLSVGFLVIFGLGGGFTAEAALQCGEINHVLIIDYDINAAAELLRHRNYEKILGDPRCTVLLDKTPEEIDAFITENYLPALCGPVKILPLRPRTEQDPACFNAAADAIGRSIEKISSDYSVQAYFGMRWFSNIIRNLKTLESTDTRSDSGPGKIFENRIDEAAICAAGPSLDIHIPLLARRKQKNRGLFIIAADTSLPALLYHNIQPDAVVSIDCQHISYYHFMGARRNIPLFIDLAGPPLLPRLCGTPVFFGSAHPLCRYISIHWRPIISLDTSGGNVTYACLSLAQRLGARRIEVYGADFSYPQGKVYARGTYIFPFFEKKQNRLAPLESLFSTFLYRSPFLAANGTTNYYETQTLRFYRQRFIEKAGSLNADVYCEPGMGPDIQISRSPECTHTEPDIRTGGSYKSAQEFLIDYKSLIKQIPLPIEGGSYIHTLNAAHRQVLLTLLPLAAAIKHRQPELHAAELIEAVKQYGIGQIEKIIN